MQGRIELCGMRFRAYHGVLEEERRCGGDFVVDFSCAYPFDQALVTDDLSDTLDYSAVYAVIAREMAGTDRRCASFFFPGDGPCAYPSGQNESAPRGRGGSFCGCAGILGLPFFFVSESHKEDGQRAGAQQQGEGPVPADGL